MLDIIIIIIITIIIIIIIIIMTTSLPVRGRQNDASSLFLCTHFNSSALWQRWPLMLVCWGC